MIFNEEMARIYDRWLDNPQGHYLDTREKTLILNLTAPQWGETMLEVGCDTGEHLILFNNHGCTVSGLEPSPARLETARQKLGNKAELYLGKAEELPFSDNEFDIVSLILPLTFANDIEKAIGEAIRVCRGRVFIGGMNMFSLCAMQLKLHEYFNVSHYQTARLFHAGALKRIVRSLLPGVRILWGSIIFLPAGWYGFAIRLEEAIPVMNNPFGAFLGLSFPVTYNLRTVQDIIGDPFKIERKETQPVQGIIRGR